MTTVLYGIKNCDTIKKAKLWLDGKSVVYKFHDFRVDGIDRKLINNWLRHVDWQVLLNTRGTTWRKLSDDTKEGINKVAAVKLMLESPAIIKRPVLSMTNNIYVGFTVDEYERIFK